LQPCKSYAECMETTTQRDSRNELHVVLGGGQIGDRISDILAQRGHEVRVVQRTPRSDARQNVTRVSGDITDLDFAERATRGASVVYDCMNPQYHQWEERLLPLGAAALHGAVKARARLVALDCLYMYGVPDGPLSEDSPRAPCSRKGELRLRLEELRMSAQRHGDVQVALGRASDFFGSDLPNSLFSSRFWQRLFAGKTVECPGDPDMPHSYTYADDVARGLVTLGERPEAAGRIWHLPTSSSESTRALFERIGRAVGQPARVAAIPQWMWHVAGVFSPMMRAAAEMTYQWKVPYVIDDSRFRATFGVSATPVDVAVREMASSVRAKYQRAA
jgi:nucleoside-diphosphate-sugar epimerase